MLWIILWLLPVFCVGENEPPTVQIPQGKLLGRWFTTRGGRNIAGFLGIPFAAPPLGPLRFKLPQPPPSWEGVFNATQDAQECVQALNPIGSEDCLYINVFTPHVSSRAKMTVMAFIFGGAFEIGTAYSFIYGPEYILDEDVVMVNFNYRLGVLGFLSLEDHVLPGNLGLKDQRAALRWIKRNIHYFGGDPLKVTLFGESAGAASVHYHMKFDNHEGLFRAALTQSGASLNPWAFQPPGSQEIYVSYIAKRTGCNEDDHKAFVECLRGVPAFHFGEILSELMVSVTPLTRQVTILPPMIEPPGAEDIFITADPWSVPTAMPLLAGVNDRECLSLNTPPFLAQDKTDSLFKLYNEKYTSFLPLNLQFNFTAENQTLVSEMLKEFYLGENPFDRPNYLSIVDLFSDGTIINGVYRAARANRHKTYFYNLSYQGHRTVSVLYANIERLGVAHGDELFFLFRLGLPEERSPEDEAFSKQLVKMWTNFAKYLNPTPHDPLVKWDPVATPKIEFLHMNQFNYTMERNFLKSRMDFWEKLPFRNKPFKFKWPYSSSRGILISEISEKYLGARHAGLDFYE